MLHFYLKFQMQLCKLDYVYINFYFVTKNYLTKYNGNFVENNLEAL